MAQKYIMISDDDAHYYVIPAEKQDLFDKLLYEEDDINKFYDEFGQCELGCSETLVIFEKNLTNC